jgi:lipopolysaccharide/colanic/teichoic acid biosynthesis glycosyltransferase
MLKRGFDLFFSFFASMFLLIPMIVLLAVSTITFRKWGLYRQIRVGRDGKTFLILKIRTMREEESQSSITLDPDPRVPGVGRLIRRTKLDEVPQLWNVLVGDMSLVGPRPDVPGYADLLKGEDRVILSVRPGITGPATLKYRDEERILAAQKDPQKYNDEVIWRDKVEINKRYVTHWTLSKDINILAKTIFA